MSVLLLLRLPSKSLTSLASLFTLRLIGDVLGCENVSMVHRRWRMCLKSEDRMAWKHSDEMIEHIPGGIISWRVLRAWHRQSVWMCILSSSSSLWQFDHSGGCDSWRHLLHYLSVWSFLACCWPCLLRWCTTTTFAPCLPLYSFSLTIKLDATCHDCRFSTTFLSD